VPIGRKNDNLFAIASPPYNFALIPNFQHITSFSHSLIHPANFSRNFPPARNNLIFSFYFMSGPDGAIKNLCPFCERIEKWDAIVKISYSGTNTLQGHLVALFGGECGWQSVKPPRNNSLCH